MAICIMAMLFIGVGMVSTISTRYLTLVSIHKPLGATIFVLAVLRLILCLRRGPPRCRPISPRP
jgi:cytochrome b561